MLNRLLNSNGRLQALFLPRQQRKLFTKSNQQNFIMQEINDKVVMIINRPEALNALTTPLCKAIYKTLRDIEKEKSLVILKGAGDRAFSSGGDLKKTSAAAKRCDNIYIQNFMTHLNICIYLIQNYKKPIMALLNGITIGGGAGLQMFATYRISTEKTRFTMPEVKIGLHPNAGATYFFNRTKGKLGYYLALTGDTLEGSDIIHAGYASHFCHHSDLEKFERELLTCLSNDDINSVIEKFCKKELPPFSLEPVLDKIDECFSEPTVEGIFEKLQEDGSVWAQQTINKMNRYSPTSLKVSLRQLQKGKDMNLADSLLMESNLTNNFFKYSNLVEGIRVALEDKSDSPNWHPKSLSQVSEDLIQSYFQPNAEKKHRELLYEVDNSRKEIN